MVHNAGSCFVVLLAALLYDRKFGDAGEVAPAHKNGLPHLLQKENVLK
ncbi:MAG: hypothetical protein Q4C55_01325 [Eubacterium sp.]|nr:hypothetical protein [Eubacterium sp.]